MSTKYTSPLRTLWAHDPQARIGCKGNENFWYGFKRNVAVTPANVTDSKALKHNCLTEGIVFVDKGYCDQYANQVMEAKGCVNRAILKNNMKKKNFARDAKISKLRMPFESVFSKQSKQAQ